MPGAAIDTAETVATNLYNIGNINSLWDFRQIATRMREVIVQTQTATTTELGRMVIVVSGIKFGSTFTFIAKCSICSS